MSFIKLLENMTRSSLRRPREPHPEIQVLTRIEVISPHLDSLKTQYEIEYWFLRHSKIENAF